MKGMLNGSSEFIGEMSTGIAMFAYNFPERIISAMFSFCTKRLPYHPEFTVIAKNTAPYSFVFSEKGPNLPFGNLPLFGDSFCERHVKWNGDWNTGAMKGSIRVIWKALVVPTGSATQDIGSYYEEEGGNSVL